MSERSEPSPPVVRRQHTKSRKGCEDCKRRKVKVCENHCFLHRRSPLSSLFPVLIDAHCFSVTSATHHASIAPVEGWFAASVA